MDICVLNAVKDSHQEEFSVAENLLVTTAWLEEHLSDPNLRIVDIRGHVLPASDPPPHYFNHRSDYDKSHIPGAVFVDWVHEITDPDDPRHAKIAQPARYAEVMRRSGIGPETFVVAYDDAAGMFAARLWWSLNYYGHSQVAILDGGWQKWVAENRPVTDILPRIKMTSFTAIANPALHRTGDQVFKALSTGAKLMDVRSIDEFIGKSSRARRKGHIPGALNQPRTDLIAADGTLLSPDELREKFARLGIDKTAPEVIVYCNGGVSASFGLLAMKVAGLENGSVYDGSWKDWGNDDSRPIEAE